LAKRRKPKRLDAGKEVRAIARERVGKVPGAKVIVSKRDKPPKHKKSIEGESE
jgi:hypothetical protein